MTSGLTPETTRQFFKDAWTGLLIACGVIYAALVIVVIVQLV